MIRRKFVIILIVLSTVMGLFIFAHSTPEITIRTHIIFTGHPILGFKTTIYKVYIDPQYGPMYASKKPRIEPVGWTYSVRKGFLGLWYIYSEGWS